MAEAVEVKYDKAQLERVRRLLREVPNQMSTVMSRGINRTARSAIVEIARRIAAKAKIKQTAIKKGITLHKATRRIWQATLDLTKKRIPLIVFKARQTKKGISYQIEKAGGRKRIPSAFIQTMPSGHKGVFRRHMPTTKRLPIIEPLGPSIGSLFEGAAGIAKDVQKSTAKKLEKNIDAQIKYILEKRRAG